MQKQRTLSTKYESVLEPDFNAALVKGRSKTYTQLNHLKHDITVNSCLNNSNDENAYSDMLMCEN